jgi:hypothetical protein
MCLNYLFNILNCARAWLSLDLLRLSPVVLSEVCGIIALGLVRVDGPFLL